MSAAVRLDTALLLGRQRANQETLDQAQALVTDAEGTANYNYHLQQIYRELVRSRRGYYRKDPPQAIVTANGVSAYALAADFLEVISVDWNFSLNEVVPIAEYTEAERNRFRVVPGWYRNQPVAYQLQGNKINFIPTPQGAQSVTVHYVPVFVPLAAPGDTFDGVAGFEDYAIWKLAAFMCTKDDDEITAAYCELQAAGKLSEVKAMAKNRSGMAPRVQRVRRFRKLGWVS